jgi:hypothetical protein
MSEYIYKLTEKGMHRTNNKNSTIVFDSIYEAEQYFKKEYGCFNTYFGYSTIINGPLLDFTSSVRDRDIYSNEDRDNINYVHNKNTINLIFPHEQLRISGSKSFMYKFPFVKALIEGDFNKGNFIKYLYTEDFGVDDKEEILGSTTIIIENDLESILLDKPLTIKRKNWESKKYWKIEDVVVENMYQLIIQFNNEYYYDTKFREYDADDY